MTKAQMARELVARGSAKRFETLRKYDADTLQAMLDAQHGEAEPAPIVELAPYIPTDAEIMRAALPAPVAPPVPLESPINRWLALALSPFLMLRGIVGV